MYCGVFVVVLLHLFLTTDRDNADELPAMARDSQGFAGCEHLFDDFFHLKPEVGHGDILCHMVSL